MLPTVLTILRRSSVTVLPFFALLLTAPLKLTAAQTLYEFYAVIPYKTAGDVYCSTYAADSYEYPTWAEYFGGGCEGRQCKYSSAGDMLVHLFR
ncbi:hypothetical protein HPB52_002807 [Rhipicephalus sanguineus]|uniref:Uncharacterized protein n=1 Tax=Rhipicephalus sanguineus TaxID=34632 RepID=A0A9D4PUW1_RHISA|nr:hypothetical protein HPB52_002807 [Rhipicephalus sanguineus]